MRRAAIQAAGYPVLLGLVYEWLGIADRSAWDVALSGVLAAAIVCGAVWLMVHAIGGPARRSLAWVAAAAAVAAGSVWISGRVKPLYAASAWMVGIAALVALLPVVAGARPVLGRRRYWALALALVAAGVALPWLLVRWVPQFQNFGAQTASLVVRFGMAYAIALAAWLTLVSLPRRLLRTTASRSAGIA